MRHPASPRTLLPALLSALVLVLAGCGQGQSGSGPADDELVVYSGRNSALVKPLLDRFAASTGTKLFVRYGGDSATTAAALAEEGVRTPADVFFSQDAGALGALGAQGRLDPLPPELLERVDARYRATDGTWIGTSGRARVLVYDPQQVAASDLPDSVFDLTDARWRGKVGYAPTNASFQAFVTGLRELAGEDRARAWLTGMKANDIRAYDNNVRVLDAVERGEVAVGLINHYYWYEKAAEVGQDKVHSRLHYLPGDPGGLVNVAGVGVLRGTDKGAQARRLVEFLLTPESQRYFAEQTKEYPLVEGVPLDEELPPLSRLDPPALDLARLSSLQRTQELLREVGLS
ncbi:MAG: iron ABC transporter substrate-binding protein [Actinomycetota bacterium]|nr:iron ABC transporter substrate-binding protein [Actinomycetota bacterium]